VRTSILSLMVLLAMPAVALGQDAPPPPGTPERIGSTVDGTWSNSTVEGGAPAVGIGTAEASLAFMCFPGVGVALAYHSSVPMPSAILQAKSVHILFGEMLNPKTKKGGAVIEGVVDPPIDPSTLLISGEGVDKMLDLASKAVENLRMAVVDNGAVVNADNFSTKGSTAAIKQFRDACSKG